MAARLLIAKRQPAQPMASGQIPQNNLATGIQCLHYALNLPTSVVITGCDSMQRFEQALEAPPGDWLYEAGGQPVQVMWGHASETTAPSFSVRGSSSRSRSRVYRAGCALKTMILLKPRPSTWYA